MLLVVVLFLHDISFIRAHFSFNLIKFARFFIKSEFYKITLNVRTFNVGGVA